MDVLTINAAINQLCPQLNEKAAIWFAPGIPEEVVSLHQKRYLDLESGETPLIVVNKESTMFTGLCITNKRLAMRLNGMTGASIGVSQNSIIFNMNIEEVKTLSCILDTDHSVRILVNNQNVGYLSQMSKAGKSDTQSTDRLTDETYRILDLIFKILSDVQSPAALNGSLHLEENKTTGNSTGTPSGSMEGPKEILQPKTKRGLFETFFISPLIKHYADLKGTATRSDYWYYVLCYNLFCWGVSGCFNYIFNNTGGVVFSILTLALLVPSLAIAVRRLRDIGKSGWMLLVLLIPIVGVVWLLVLFCKKGKATPSRFRLSIVDIVAVAFLGFWGGLYYYVDFAQTYYDNFDKTIDEIETIKQSKRVSDILKSYPYEPNTYYLISDYVPDCCSNILFGIGSNDKRDLDNEYVDHYGEPAIVYSVIDGTPDEQKNWKVLLKFSDISDDYQSMFIKPVPASFDPNILYFNYHFDGSEEEYSGKVDVKTGDFDRTCGYIVGMITKGSYKNMYLKYMGYGYGDFMGIYKQSPVGVEDERVVTFQVSDYFDGWSNDDIFESSSGFDKKIIRWIENQ